MKKKTLLKLLLLFFVLEFCSCSHETFSGAWQAKSVKVDAKTNDWEIPLRFYDDKTKLNYSITNDLNNIYLCIRAADPQTQTKIINAGMQLWIDTTGNTKHTIGITFPLSTGAKMKYGEQLGTDESGLNLQSRQETAKMRGDFIASNKQMKVTGFKPPFSGFLPLNSDSGINLSINWDSTNMIIYEAKIPFRTFYKKSLSLSDSAKVISIGIFVNGVEVISPTDRRGGAEMPVGGMSGQMPGGSGMGAGMRGGGGNNYGTFTHTKSVWCRFKLAVNH